MHAHSSWKSHCTHSCLLQRLRDAKIMLIWTERVKGTNPKKEDALTTAGLSNMKQTFCRYQLGWNLLKCAEKSVYPLFWKLTAMYWYFYVVALMINRVNNVLNLCLNNVLNLCVRSTCISMGYFKKDVTPLLTNWSYFFLALTHRFDHHDSWGHIVHRQLHSSKRKAVWYSAGDWTLYECASLNDDWISLEEINLYERISLPVD